jgi:hypothetical protein
MLFEWQSAPLSSPRKSPFPECGHGPQEECPWLGHSILRARRVPSRRACAQPTRWQPRGSGSRSAPRRPARPRIGANTSSVERQADRRANHGNVHLGPRNETEIGVRQARRTFRQVKLDDELARVQGDAPRTRGNTFHGNLSPPLWAGDHATTC